MYRFISELETYVTMRHLRIILNLYSKFKFDSKSKHGINVFLNNKKAAKLCVVKQYLNVFSLSSLQIIINHVNNIIIVVNCMYRGRDISHSSKYRPCLENGSDQLIVYRGIDR